MIDLDEAQRRFEEGDAAAAQRLVDGFLAAYPDSARALFLSGRIQEQAGNDGHAKQFYERAIHREVDFLVARLHLAAVLCRLREFEKSLDELSYVLYREPNNARAYFEMAYVHRVRGETDSAIGFLEQALAIRPDYADAMVELGALYLGRDRLNEGVALLERAAELNPLSMPAENNLAFAYVRLEQYERGFAVFSKLCERTPDSVLWPRINLGNALDNLGEYEKSERVYEQILRHEPNNLAARWNRAPLLLAKCNFGEGWEEYQYRMQQDEVWKARLIPFEPWKGQPLAGKSIVVSAEQGLGDQIMFASCLPDLVAVADKVVVECDQRLHALFARSFAEATVIPSRHEMKPPWLQRVGMLDYHIPAGSLPRYFRQDENRFPEHRGYLLPDHEKVRKWRSRLAELGPGLKVGLSWRGGTKSTRRRLRSLELRELEEILRVSGCRFISLQYGDCQSEIDDCRRDLRVAITHWQDAIDDYDETAALCSALDLTISVCTSVIHLNGALACPIWILVPAVAEWRYGRAGTRMPWYPSALLFRQTHREEWQSVVREVARSLAEKTRSVDG